MLCRISEARALGMSCWVPILRAAGLWVLRTMEEEEGETVGEKDGVGEAEEREEEEEEACLVSCEVAEEVEDCLWRAGEGERGVGGSEDVREDRDGMLEVELWEGVGARWAGGEELADRKDRSSWSELLSGTTGEAWRGWAPSF